MKQNTPVKPPRNSARWAVVGIDLGDSTSQAAVLGKDKQILTEFPLPTNPAAFRAKFQRRRPTLFVIEVGAHSHWCSHLLEELGHAVIVADPRQLALISQSAKRPVAPTPSPSPGSVCPSWRCSIPSRPATRNISWISPVCGLAPYWSPRAPRC